MEKRERGRIQRLPKVVKYPLLSQERVKVRTSNFIFIFIGSFETKTKTHYNFFENSSRGRSQKLPKIFRAL